jgi:hypothetical protein
MGRSLAEVVLIPKTRLVVVWVYYFHLADYCFPYITFS